MNRIRVLGVLIALATLTACSGSKPTAAPRTTTTIHHAISVAPKPTTTPTTISHAQEVAAQNNPTHDPTKCVRELPDGYIAVTIKDFIPKGAPMPTGPTPYGWCG